MSLGVEVRDVSNNVTETQRHITYMCGGSEANLTECTAREYSFVCSKVGKVICQGLYNYHSDELLKSNYILA
jgi:hypothetical protein